MKFWVKSLKTEGFGLVWLHGHGSTNEFGGPVFIVTMGILRKTGLAFSDRKQVPNLENYDRSRCPILFYFILWF